MGGGPPRGPGVDVDVARLNERSDGCGGTICVIWVYDVQSPVHAAHVLVPQHAARRSVPAGLINPNEDSGIREPIFEGGGNWQMFHKCVWNI